MRSRLHALSTLLAAPRFRVMLAMLAALVWLAPSAALASEGHADASFSASFVPAAPRAEAPVPIGPSTATSRAPLCDPRGAITFASAPQMQDVEATLDTGLTLDDCFGDSGNAVNTTRRAGPGRAPRPIDASSASSDAAVLATRIVLAACARELLPAPGASTTCSRPGIRSTVDRPPRA